MASLRICFVAAEVAPFAKVGGLGDVAAALPRALHRSGHDVRLFMPLYGLIDRDRYGITPADGLDEVTVGLGGRRRRFGVFTAELPRSPLRVHLIDCPDLFGRPAVYTQDPDEPSRFAMLSRAAIECCRRLGWAPDVFHCNDWHTSLLPLYLETEHGRRGGLSASGTLLTLHNLGYQGVFPTDVLTALDLAGEAPRLDTEDFAAGRINFLKTGVRHADLLNTVSPTHAREIQTAEYGMGLDPLLRRRRDDLVGILNGVDLEEWDPATDPLIPFHYTADDLTGKAAVKRALHDERGLAYDPRAPALGMVTRLVRQKGIGLLREVLPDLVGSVDCRLVVLGSGEPEYQTFFADLQARYPARVSFHAGFDNPLAHRIEAGCDLFLMPSLYEPCGLNQLYSLRYGTPPVVRKVGGLADSVQPFDAATGEGTGFVFDRAEPDALRAALDRALAVWRDRSAWRRLVANGMRQDFSWERQADRYVALYRRLVARRRSHDGHRRNP